MMSSLAKSRSESVRICHWVVWGQVAASSSSEEALGADVDVSSGFVAEFT